MKPGTWVRVVRFGDPNNGRLGVVVKTFDDPDVIRVRMQMSVHYSRRFGCEVWTGGEGTWRRSELVEVAGKLTRMVVASLEEWAGGSKR